MVKLFLTSKWDYNLNHSKSPTHFMVWIFLTSKWDDHLKGLFQHFISMKCSEVPVQSSFWPGAVDGMRRKSNQSKPVCRQTPQQCSCFQADHPCLVQIDLRDAGELHLDRGDIMLEVGDGHSLGWWYAAPPPHIGNKVLTKPHLVCTDCPLHRDVKSLSFMENIFCVEETSAIKKSSITSVGAVDSLFAAFLTEYYPQGTRGNRSEKRRPVRKFNQNWPLHCCLWQRNRWHTKSVPGGKKTQVFCNIVHHLFEF